MPLDSSQLASFCGDLERTRHWLKVLLMTPGVLYVGENGTVRSIACQYNDLGQGFLITSWSNPDGSGDMLDQIEYAFDGWGDVTRAWQSHAGAVDDSVDESNRTYRRNVTAENENAGLDEVYSYDALNRLTETDRGTLSADGTTFLSSVGQEVWTLDQLGNWESYNGQTRTSNSANEITDLSGTANDPTYDAAGNMTSDGTFNYTYDAWNRQVAVHARNANGTTGSLVAQYAYDGLNRRTSKSVALASGLYERTDTYFDENWQVLQQCQSISYLPDAVACTVYSQYVWDLRYIDAPILRLRDADGDSSTGARGLEEKVFYTNDANMNVTGLVDAASGQVVERYSFASYGKDTIHTSSWTVAIDASAWDAPVL